MKKLIVTLCVGLTMCCLSGCGSRNDQSGGQTQSDTQNSIADTSESNVGSTTDADDGLHDISGGWSSEMQQIKDAVVEVLGDNYWPDTAMPPEMLEGNFGISSDMYDDYLAESPMISANVDTLLIIKAKDDKVEDVENALNDYRDALVNDTMQYPMNLGKIHASRIERYGNYVCFVQLGAEAGILEDQSEDDVINECREINELVLAVIKNSIPD